MNKEVEDPHKLLRNSKRTLRRSEKFINELKEAMILSGIDPEAVKAKNRKIAAKMGITTTQLGLLTKARWEAEMTARKDETTEETEARAQKLWLRYKSEQEERDKELLRLMKSFTPEERKSMISLERRRLLAKERRRRIRKV